MIKRLVLVLICAAMAPCAASAQDTSPSSTMAVAQAYMQAYSNADWDTMGDYMAEDFVLIDRTNPDPGFEPEHRGRDVALQMLRNFGAEQGVIDLGMEFPVVFESNDIVVFSGHVNIEAAPPGADYGYRWRTEMVSVLTMRDGRVVRHEDYANYRTPTTTRLPRP